MPTAQFILNETGLFMVSAKIRRRVCILTTAHHPRDDRIFHKQALSLAQAGLDVAMIANWTDTMDSGPVRKLPLPAFHGKLDRWVRGLWCVLRLALQEKADVYHFHDPELLPLGVALKIFGKRVIYDVHEDYSRKVRSRALPRLVGGMASGMIRIVESLCASCFDQIITADSHVASLFAAHKTTVVANYPPKAFVAEPAQDGALEGHLRLAYVGGISVIRGIGKILEALDALKDPSVEFHLAGNVLDASIRTALEKHPQVVYHGILPWEQVNHLLRQTQLGMLLLQPVGAYTYYPGENIIKLWEYLGMGLPVIISDFPKLKGLIEGLDAGLAVDPTDPIAIAAAIRTLRDDPGLRRRLGENGRAAVLRERNWEAESQKLLAVYHRLGAVPKSGASQPASPTSSSVLPVSPR